MISKTDALLKLCSGAEWLMQDDKIVKWHSKDIKQPTEEEIKAKQAELQADYDSKQYQRDRAEQYPSIQDQLDKIYHSGLTAWKADIKAVKDKFPKP